MRETSAICAFLGTPQGPFSSIWHCECPFQTLLPLVEQQGFKKHKPKEFPNAVCYGIWKQDPFVSCSIRKILMSVIFPPAIPGPERPRQFYGCLGYFGFFLQENPHAHKVPLFLGGGGWVFFGMGGGSGRWDFLNCFFSNVRALRDV